MFHLKYRPHLPFFLCVAYPASTFCSRGAVRPWPDSTSCPLFLGFTFHPDSYRGSFIPQSLASVWRDAAADRIAEPLKKALGCSAQPFLLGEKPADRKHLLLITPPMASSVSAQDAPQMENMLVMGLGVQSVIYLQETCVLTYRLGESYNFASAFFPWLISQFWTLVDKKEFGFLEDLKFIFIFIYRAPLYIYYIYIYYILYTLYNIYIYYI